MTPVAHSGGEPIQATTAGPKRVLIVDDHEEFRSRAHDLLSAAGYCVIGEASDATSGLAEVRRLRPDLVLLDVQLPDGDGFTVAGKLAGVDGAPRVILISSREAVDYGSRIAQSRASGFIHKPELTRARLAEIAGPPE
jgi:DNA-binding NarL/FixJ family response regulator